MLSFIQSAHSCMVYDLLDDWTVFTCFRFDTVREMPWIHSIQCFPLLQSYKVRHRALIFILNSYLCAVLNSAHSWMLYDLLDAWTVFTCFRFEAVSEMLWIHSIQCFPLMQSYKVSQSSFEFIFQTSVLSLNSAHSCMLFSFMRSHCAWPTLSNTRRFFFVIIHSLVLLVLHRNHWQPKLSFYAEYGMEILKVTHILKHNNNNYSAI